MISPNAHANPTKVLAAAAVVIAVGGLALLSVEAAGRAYTDLDVRVAEGVQSLDFPSLDLVMSLVNFFTDAPMAIAVWLIATTFFVLRGRPLEALAVFSISGLWIANLFLGMAVDRSASPAEIGEAVRFSREESGSFPSGHVTGVVVFYGLLAFLALSNLRRGKLRTYVPVLAFSAIAVTSLSRVYSGAHWPSDVLGNYLLGFLGVAAIAWMYSTVREDRLHIPRIRKKQPAPAIDGVTLAGSIASTVYLDWRAGTATKEYRPPWPVRALYWLAFQAPFPYEARRDALEAAAAKRKVAGLLTRHQYGRDMVAAVHGIRNGGSTYGFVTELVPGSSPRSNREVEGLLSEMYSYFQEVGLPTWQIAPGNPHAYSNFIRTPEGELKLIDIESSIVSFSPPFRQLMSALRDGNYPVFDDVDFVRLRGYVGSHASELTRSLGPDGLDELNEAIESAERSSLTWKESEPRLWGRMAQRVYRILDVSVVIEGLRRSLRVAEGMAKDFLTEAVDRWEREARIDAEQAASLRYTLSTPEATDVVKHMGAHLVLTAVIAVPIPGPRSLARFGWTLGFRLRALYARARGRITGEEYRAARSAHRVPVMLLALVPVLGAVAYAASDTMVRKGLGRLLLDQAASSLPFGLYRRLGLRHIFAPRLPRDSHRAPTLRRRAVALADSLYHRVSTGLRLPQHSHAPVRIAGETRR